MKNSRSFKEYVTNRFYNQFCDAVSHFIEDNLSELDLRSNRVTNIDSASVSDITVKGVSVDNLPDMAIAFDVILEVEIEVSECDRHNDYSDQCYPWLMLHCRGDLDCNLDDFTVCSISSFNKKRKLEVPMDDALVPYITKDKLEEAATDFLKRNYPEALRSPISVDPTELAKRMGLTIEPKHITSDFSVFGQIFFCDCDTEYYDPELDEMVPTSVKGKTIFFDPSAYFLRNLGSVNNTIIHECVHWDEHRKAFELERLYNINASQIKCEVVGGIRKCNVRTATDWMEWQANALTPRIQMPLVNFKMKAAEVIKKYRAELHTFELVDVMEPVIQELSVFYGVSKSAAKIRMVDIGYDEAIGAFNYIDGHYIRPYGFKKNAITKKQTYAISQVDAIIQGILPSKFSTDLQSGKYQYVESHYCFNSPKYITSGSDGNPCMTEYARLHVDECCVVFDLSVKSTNKYGETFYTECALYRDADSNVIFEAHYSDDNKESKSEVEQFAAYKDDVLGVLKSLPESFPMALKKVVEWSDMTEEDIAWEADMSTRQLQRLLNDDEQNPQLDTVVLICLAMRLPPLISAALIKKSGHTFKASDRDFTLQMLLNGYYTHSLEECNKILINQHLLPLGKTARGQLNEKS